MNLRKVCVSWREGWLKENAWEIKCLLSEGVHSSTCPLLMVSLSRFVCIHKVSKLTVLH